MRPRSTLRVLVAASVLALSSIVVTASPASADRCQPEELVNLPGILDERDTPVCFVMDTWVYPFLCPDAIPSPTTCAANIDPDLNNPPNPFDIRNYRPNAFRMYCSAYLWIWDRAGQNATCQF